MNAGADPQRVTASLIREAGIRGGMRTL